MNEIKNLEQKLCKKNMKVNNKNVEMGDNNE